MRKRSVKRVVGFAVVALLFVAVACLVLMALWNALMPEIFGLKSITYWQALGLLVLSRFLIGGLGLGGRHGHWRHRMQERLETLTPEEREKFMAAIENRRCGSPRPPADTAATS
jgi:hypothetical protein